MLQKAANILRKSCRHEDIKARWGGDEFVLFLMQVPEEEIKSVCERIRNYCNETRVRDVPLTMALGFSIKSSVNQDIEEVLKEAEDSMYQQKLAESWSTRNLVLSTLLKTLGEKSYETREHVQRMEQIAIRIGEKVGLSDTELSRLKLLTTLHDIGKINIPEDILVKKGPLDEKEWKLIKKHPETGYRIARATEEFAHVAEDILCHHERWDGTGYPQGLKETEIPLLARIVSIADAYEVMSNGRPYKEPLSREEIIAEIKRCAGSQFDPDLVELFLSI